MSVSLLTAINILISNNGDDGKGWLLILKNWLWTIITFMIPGWNQLGLRPLVYLKKVQLEVKR